jgi:hypothetical protein
MAQTTGLVQRLKLTNGLVLAWAYIGPTSSNTTLLIIKQPTPLSPDEVALRAAMAEALSAALSTRQQVVATHADNDVEITALQVNA